MDQTEQLRTFKANLKKRISEDLEQALESLFSTLNDSSDFKNELIHLEGQFNQLESETRKGIIDYNFRSLQLNRIREGTLQLVGQLEISDLTEKAILSLHVKEKEEEQKEESAKESIVQTRAIDNPEKEQAHKPEHNISLTDFELFVEENPVLKAFPKVYREARAIIFRNDKAGKAHQLAYQAIYPALPVLTTFESLISPIRENINQIRLNHDHRKYWVRYKQIKEIAFDVELENLSEVEKGMADLEQLHRELSSLKLI